MERTVIAKIAVSAATYSIDKPYDYRIPPDLLEAVQVGVRVMVPFGRGNRPAEGMVLAIAEGEKTPRLKAISSVLDEASVMSESDVRLALWMRERYFCTFYDAAKTILPAGIWYQLQVIYHLCDGISPETARNAAGKSETANKVIDAVVNAGGALEQDTLRKSCGENTGSVLSDLVEKGVLWREEITSRAIKDKTIRLVSLAVPPEEAMAAVERRRKAAPLRYEVIKLLCEMGPLAASDVIYYTGASPQTLKGLERSGLVSFSREEVFRVPRRKEACAAAPIVLNDEQMAAYRDISALMAQNKPAAVLLEGVTGSGKTQVYIRLVQQTLEAGKRAMVLVPEIALTTQLMDRFSAYFGDKAVMLHSSLRMSERYDQWKRIYRGEVDVVLGTRSAVFAPLRDIGLIILDEEQESSYQSENVPRYHARDIAKFRCREENAVLLLGSATPSVESAYQAREGFYHHCKLQRRYNQQALPKVILADMRKELRAGNNSLISEELQKELSDTMARGEQSILFLNRRGNSRMLLCGECGAVPECPRCSIPLTYHSANGRLMCHYCGHSEKAEESCRTCGGVMKHIGSGTQKMEEELRVLFPDTAILRMDADTVGANRRHEDILRKFTRENIPILLGTQMVAKGLDFPNVTLVGVLLADLSLYVDHYRAAERTFSLLTQVVGRAGRGERQGRAVIQTFTPENDVITQASQQAYDRFYAAEIRMRRMRRYPPFADLFTMTVSGLNEEQVLRACTSLKNAIRSALVLREFQGLGLEVLGPAPAAIVKVNHRYRYHLTLIGVNNKQTRDFIAHYIKAFYNNRENRGLHIFVDCNAAD